MPSLFSASHFKFSVAFLVVLLSGVITSAAERKPNVILVITDDQGYGDVGAHGNEKIKTPNLDVLYRQCLRLTDYHVDPTCSPTRSALMTGRYSSAAGVWHTIMGRSILHREEVTLADVLKAAGYRTGMTGKWHLGDCYPYLPLDRGFEEALHHGGGGIGQTPDAWGNDYFDDRYWEDGKLKQYQGYCTDVFFDWSLKFVEKHKERPFFLYLSTNVPHGPFNVAKKYSEPYREAGVPGSMANFYGMITNFDENMGRLMEKLKQLGLEKDTILIFTTDNGTAAGVTRRRGKGWQGFNAGMRGRKGSEYDGGHRVPCFIRWPEKIAAGRDVDQLTAHIDVLPTLAELTGADIPKSVKLHGKSLVPLLKSADAKWPERTLTVHSQRIETPQKWRKSSVMTDRWRLVNGKELYDIQADPGQKDNIASANPQVVKQLRDEYDRWWKLIDERFDGYVRIPLGDKAANPTSFTCHDWHGPRVPWNQGHIRSNMKANGFWSVDVAKDGRYAVTLRLRPEGEKFPLQAGTATVKVGEVEKTVDIPEGESAATVTLDLKAGPAKLWTTLKEKQRGARGAYYVTVERVE